MEPKKQPAAFVADDICAHAPPLPATPAIPHAPPIYLSSVYECASPDAAEAMLSGSAPGFVYQRDGHPNADLLAAQCQRLHRASWAAVTASGMSALAAASLALLKAGDHVVASQRVYGKSLKLLHGEFARLGIECTIVDTCNLELTANAFLPRTRLVLVETIDNPLLRIANLKALAHLAESRGAFLLVDNTFASPVVCRPLEWGAHLVIESLTKSMNGHSDTLLGMVCGRTDLGPRIREVLSSWGFTAAPFDCYLALRGIATLPLRLARSCANALEVANFLLARSEVARVDYPGLVAHPDHELARTQFGAQFGHVVTFHLRGGRAAADRFLPAIAARISFCPSLGECATTISHPESTSHRTLSADARQELGISGGTLRLSLGIESIAYICTALEDGLRTLVPQTAD